MNMSDECAVGAVFGPGIGTVLELSTANGGICDADGKGLPNCTEEVVGCIKAGLGSEPIWAG